MNWPRIATVFRKELVDALRDRRTIISSLVIPILLFPVLILGFGAVATKAVRKMSRETSSIMLLGAEHAPALAGLLRTNQGFSIEPTRPDYAAAISDKKLRAAVEFPAGFEAALASPTTNPPQVKIYHYASEMRSEFALHSLREIIERYRNRIVKERLAAKGLTRDLLRPFEAIDENVASPEKVGGNLLGGLVPYMLILLCLIGAMNPAMDITAGEKERGTIETLLASPITRRDLVLGKFFMVLAVCLFTAIVSLVSYGITFSLPFFALKELSELGPLKLDLSLASILFLFVLVVPLAVMFSALLLALSSFAKSYKEAQSYVAPLMVIVIFPAVAVMLPGIELNYGLALVPVLNVSLVCTEVLSGTYHWGLIFLVFTASSAYAIAALSATVYLFKQEAVLFRS